MLRRPCLALIVLLIAAMVSQDFVPLLHAQDADANPPPTAQQLDQLLAPIALYPDALLAQITTACTDPQEILDVDNWLQQNPDLTGTALTDAAQAAGFDPAFIALVNFPQVIAMMAENIDDYTAIGEAFSADQASVTDSIQRLRAQAYDAGALRSNSEMQVEVQKPAASQTVYVIQPANPQVVYVPVYDPTVVYVAPAPNVAAATLITFGAGIAIGALLVDNRPWGWGGWGWNWDSRRAYYNHTVWVGWGNPYRPPNPWYRPRPVYYRYRPGYGGNWRYRPPNYRPPKPPSSRPPGHRPPWSPTNPPPAGPKPRPQPKPNPKPNPKPAPGPKPSPNPKPSPQPKPSPTPGPKPAPQPKPQPKPSPDNPSIQPQPKPSPTRRSKPQPKPAPDNPSAQPQPKPNPEPKPAPQPKPQLKPEPQPKPAAQPKPAPQPKPQQKTPSRSKPAPQSQPNTQPERQ
jgi:hypothetical protein